MNGLGEIRKVHVWIYQDMDDTEGIPAVDVPGLGPMQLMCGDQPGAVSIVNGIAKQLARDLGRPVRHVVFETRTEVEVHQP